jgi:hypothetical protein
MKATWTKWVALGLLVGATTAVAASVVPVLFEDWQAGDAAFECNEAGLDCDFAYKFDEWDGSEDGPYVVDGGNTITILGADAQAFSWTSQFPVCAVIVKGGPSANVYYYDGALGDTALVAPVNPRNGQNYDISHVTFCYDDPDTCYQEETAWSTGPRYVRRGNWATSTPYVAPGGTVKIFAGQTLEAGTATFSAPDADGKVTITINLTGGFIFYYDGADVVADDNLKVQDYATAPSGNPAPGLFAWKKSVTSGATTATITVPRNNFYGVHLDVARPVACP